nr:DUF2270 domain-containing protein [Salipiger pentaromativorans]
MAEAESEAETPFAPSAAEIGAVAHLYRGEIYRCTVWRTRLDTTTNWAVVTLGVALSISYAAPDASPLPLVLVGILNLFFLTLEARRYRYCDAWGTRFRTMERNFYAPILDNRVAAPDPGWSRDLARDYLRPAFRIGYLHALGRRIRRGYLWIMFIQNMAFLGKLVVHPRPAASWQDLFDRAAVGGLPGWLMFLGAALYMTSFCALAVWSGLRDRRHRRRHDVPAPDAAN